MQHNTVYSPAFDNVKCSIQSRLVSKHCKKKKIKVVCPSILTLFDHPFCAHHLHLVFFYSLKLPSCEFHWFSKARQNSASAPTIWSVAQSLQCVSFSRWKQLLHPCAPEWPGDTKTLKKWGWHRWHSKSLPKVCDWVAPLEVDIIPTFPSPSHTTIPNYLATKWLICQVKML